MNFCSPLTAHDSLLSKTALVTGGAKRIGRAISLALADAGANVIVHYNNSSKEADELVAELRKRGPGLQTTAHHENKAWTVQADFEKPDEYESLIERALAEAGSIDILINSASIFPSEKIENITFDGFATNMQVNAWAPFVLCRDFARLVGKGTIVNLLDSRISGYDWAHAGYIWSKHVLAVMTRMLALDYAPDITVNAVAPGLILPPPGQDESYLDRLTGTVPLKRHGGASDVAEAAVFLAKSNFITGQVIYVDGGRHLKEYTNG